MHKYSQQWYLTINARAESFIVSSPFSETAIYFQSVYYNETVSSEYWNICLNLQQVKTEWGVRERGRERERERGQQINGVRDGALDRNGNGVG